MPATHLIGPLLFLLMAGCAGLEHPPPEGGLAAPAPVAAASEAPKVPSRGTAVARSSPPDAKAAAKAPASPVAAAPPRQDVGSPPLDLAALETRLRGTKAIGVFTKIALKNQVDDLLDQFREHYSGRVKTSLVALRQPYDRLLLKVLALLQDGDPELARAVVASREPMWDILADPARFAAL